MTDLEVPLTSIRAAFQGVIPSVIATASKDGVPNCTYLSIVWYVDEERVALSNQFLRKTAANLRENPHAVIRVVDPATMTEYDLEVRWLHSESSGECFEAVRTQLDAVAAQSGASDVFRLRGIELLRVDRCAPVGRAGPRPHPNDSARELVASLDTFVRRMSECRDLAEVTRTALESLEDLFAFDRSILFLAAPEDDSLFVVASNGLAVETMGAEVRIGDGIIGVAADRHRQVRVGDLERLTRAGTEPVTDANVAPEVPASGLDDASSVLATPLLLHDRLVGVLYLDSPDAGRFTADDARVVAVLAAHLAVNIALQENSALQEDSALQETSAFQESESPETVVVPQADEARAHAAEATVDYYDHDGTVFVDGSYVIKGVAGRILFSMLSEHVSSGRRDFSNRELRLDRSLGLPAGKDNLEARLLTLRRRLAERDDPFRVERVGRGQLRLTVDGPLRLERHDH